MDQDLPNPELHLQRQARHFAASTELLGVADVSGHFSDVNPAFARALGYSEDELCARPFLTFVHPDDVANTEAALKRLTTGRNIVSFENRCRAVDGSYRSLAWTWTSMGSSETELYATARDTTLRKDPATDLERLNAELTRSNRDLQQFAYVASHDLQEPLRAVAGCAQLLQRRYQGKLDASADELIEHTVDGVKRMQTLINDLLLFSRVATGSARPEPTPLSDAVSEAQANLSTLIKESGAVITCGPLPTVVADAGQMTQLFQNLLSNAIKFGDTATPRVTIASKREGGVHLVMVADNGIGIATEHLERVFILFQRLHTRAEYPGTGIGLALCRKIVERHGGKAWIESQPGHGATFFFTLPERSESA